MEHISGLLLGFCFAAVVGGLVHLLSPGGTTERAFRILVTLFMLSTMLSPLSALRQSIPTIRQGTGNVMAENAAQAVLDTAETAIRKVAEDVLRQKSCADAQVEITMQVRDGEAHTERFILYGVPQEKAKEVADEIFAHTGERPTVESNP